MPDEFNMSGNFQGAFINIRSTLTDVQQSAGGLSTGDPGTRAELQKQIQQLSDILQKIPAELQDEAQAVAQATQALVDTAKDANPNRTMLQITGEGLKKAAQNLAAVAPLVLPLASQIVATVTQMIASR
jgi:hypothetical protein